MPRLFTLIFFILVSLSAGALGSLSMGGSIEGWYATLTRPFWTPPNWVFAPVWTALYVLMGCVAYLVSQSNTRGKIFALWLFLAHLLVNAFWSIAFFGMHEILLATVVIVFLWLLILLLMRLFWKHSHTATYLLVPYLLWVTYASTLNVGLLLLN